MELSEVSVTASKDPLFTVVVPTYCEEQNIGRCLESIQKQVFEEGRIETIVVDSNSPDKTRLIAKKYTNKVVNMKDRGVGKARNLGARKAAGEFLVFVDADTVLDPHFLEGVHHALNHSNAVYVVGTMAGLEWSGTADNLLKFLHYGLVNLISTVTAHLGFPFFPTVCCACKKTAFRKAGGFDEDIAIAEDLKFSLRMGKIGKCLVSRRAKAYTSLRRIQKNGMIKNSYMYLSNYFKVFILNKRPWIRDFPHTSETKDGRLIS